MSFDGFLTTLKRFGDDFSASFGDDDRLQRGATIVFERRMFLKRRKIGLFDVKTGLFSASGERFGNFRRLPMSFDGF